MKRIYRTIVFLILCAVIIARSRDISSLSDIITAASFSGSDETEENDDSDHPEEETSSSGMSYKEFSLDAVPEYTGEPYVDINDDIPFFTEEEITPDAFEYYGELDDLGRCTMTVACVGPETLPTEKRGGIGMVKPTGWHTVKYDFINGKYLFNRCHLIGYQLTGENANERNLITGTRYLNIEGMLPFENSVREYIDGTGNHVMYRVTPYFKGDDLLARGVLMEAQSVEDPAVRFCVFCYNVQPGVEIDYRTGDNHLSE